MAPKVERRKRFRVYVLHPSGKATRGRYYNIGSNAYARAKSLKDRLTQRYKVVIYHIHRGMAISEGRGYWPEHGMSMFCPPSLRLSKA